MSIDKQFLAEECGVDESELENSFNLGVKAGKIHAMNSRKCENCQRLIHYDVVTDKCNYLKIVVSDEMISDGFGCNKWIQRND